MRTAIPGGPNPLAIPVLVALLALAGAAAADPLPEFPLTDYATGPSVPANVASGCDYTTLRACATPSDGTGTNWIGPLEAAAAAAGAAGGGVITIPPGDYRFGVAGAPGFEEGAVIHDDHVFVQCSPGARLLPGGTLGAHVLNWCHDADCTNEGTATRVQGGGLIGCEFFDDDPERTGHSYQIADANGGLVGGPPKPGDIVFFAGRQGTVVAWDAAADEIRIKPFGTGPGDLLEDGDTVSSVPPAWSIADVQSVTGRSEESHGVAVLNAEDWTATDSGCRNIGDECFDVGGRAGPPATPNRNIAIVNPWCRNTPSMPSAGSCVSIGATLGASIDGIDFSESRLGPWSLNRAIDVSSLTGVPHGDMRISGGSIDASHDGILLDTQNAAWNGVEITGVTVLADVPGAFAVRSIGSGTLFDGNLHDNIFAGTLSLRGTRLRVTDNDVSIAAANPSNALFVGGVDVEVVGNGIDGGTGGCMILNQIVGGLISANTCTTNTDGNAEPVIDVLAIGACGLVDVRLEGNMLQPRGNVTHGINGRAAPNHCESYRAIGNTIDLSAGSSAGSHGILHVGVAEGNTIQIPGPASAGIRARVGFAGSILANQISLGGSGADGIVLDDAVGFDVSGNTIEGVVGATGWAVEERGASSGNRFADNRALPGPGGGLGAPFHAARWPFGGCDGGGPAGATSTDCENNLRCGDELADADCDGLDAAAEQALGTDADDPDSDGDGLPDGEESLLLGTNPLLPDSDGDGYDDRVEIAAGYDPLDPKNHPGVPEVPALPATARAIAALLLALLAEPARRWAVSPAAARHAVRASASRRWCRRRARKRRHRACRPG